MKYIIFFFSFLFSFSNNSILAQNPAAARNISQPQSKNIILFIGNGMGIGQITAGTIENGYTSALKKFPISGIHKNAAYDNLISDSAAGSTAISCGVKTNKGSLAVNFKNEPVQTIIEEAKIKGLKTGLISNELIIHPTPASFIAHNVNSRDYEKIAEEFIDSDIDYFVGGGKKYFSRRMDGNDLIQNLISKGYQIDTYQDQEIEKVKYKNNKFGYFTADESPKENSQSNFLSLVTKQGLEFLSKENSNGFILLVSSPLMEQAGNKNQKDLLLKEFIEFNKAIDQAIQWAEKDNNTLVIVTSDHETGGLSINDGFSLDTLSTLFVTTANTGTMIPVFAFGPGAELFSGIYENTQIYYKMRQALGWETK